MRNAECGIRAPSCIWTFLSSLGNSKCFSIVLD